MLLASPPRAILSKMDIFLKFCKKCFKFGSKKHEILSKMLENNNFSNLPSAQGSGFGPGPGGDGPGGPGDGPGGDGPGGVGAGVGPSGPKVAIFN